MRRWGWASETHGKGNENGEGGWKRDRKMEGMSKQRKRMESARWMEEMWREGF